MNVSGARPQQQAGWHIELISFNAVAIANTSSGRHNIDISELVVFDTLLGLV
jgi:hypothetical protein